MLESGLCTKKTHSSDNMYEPVADDAFGVWIEKPNLGIVTPLVPSIVPIEL